MAPSSSTLRWGRWFSFKEISARMFKSSSLTRRTAWNLMPRLSRHVLWLPQNKAPANQLFSHRSMASKPIESRPTSHHLEWASIEVCFRAQILSHFLPTHLLWWWLGRCDRFYGTGSIWGVLRWYPHSFIERNDGMGRSIGTVACCLLLQWNSFLALCFRKICGSARDIACSRIPKGLRHSTIPAIEILLHTMVVRIVIVHISV